MKPIRDMSLGEFAAYVCSHLRSNGIEAVLSGGACVSIYTDNRYESLDLDFIENFPTRRKRIREVLSRIGFYEQLRYFKHPDTEFFVEFPAGPISVGDEPVKQITEIQFTTGRLMLLSPTDCVKDRLAAYYHWDDRQSLNQALLVAENQDIDIEEVDRWSRHERRGAEFDNIKPLFEKRQKT